MDMVSKLFFSSLLIISGGCHKTGADAQPADSTNAISPVTIGLKHALPLILKESSGLCYTNGKLWTFGDSGNPNEIFSIDTSTAGILQTVVVDNFPNSDWEDITADSSYIYIGDFGNNFGDRTDLKIIRIDKKDITADSPIVHLNGEAINFSYTDQTDFTFSSNTNFDCESVIAIGQFLYLFTKDGIDLQTRCYKIPNLPGNYAVSPISSFDSKGKITAAAYNHQTREIVLLGYMDKKLESFIWLLNGYSDDNFFNGSAIKITIGNSIDWQTEGIDYISSNRLFLSCESSASLPAALYSVQKN
jgi:hypothetical protein